MQSRAEAADQAGCGPRQRRGVQVFSSVRGACPWSARCAGHESPADEARGRAIQNREVGIVSADWSFADRSKNSRHFCAAGFLRPFSVSTPQ